jgi:hypothetical protein
VASFHAKTSALEFMLAKIQDLQSNEFASQAVSAC